MLIRAAFVIISIVLIALCPPSLGQEQTASYWIDKGKELSSNSSYNLAIKCFDRAIDIDSQSAYAWYYKGWALSRLNKYEDAFEAYNKSVKINPLLANAWTYRGLSQLMMGYNFPETIESFDDAIALNQSDGLAWLAKGISLATFSFNESIKCFDKVIQLNQSKGLVALAYSSKAVVLLEILLFERPYFGRPGPADPGHLMNEAINSFQKSIESTPSSPYVLGYDGLYELQKSNKTYIDGYIIDPSQLLAANHGIEGYALNISGNQEEAIIHLRASI